MSFIFRLQLQASRTDLQARYEEKKKTLTEVSRFSSSMGLVGNRLTCTTDGMPASSVRVEGSPSPSQGSGPSGDKGQSHGSA